MINDILMDDILDKEEEEEMAEEGLSMPKAYIVTLSDLVAFLGFALIFC